MFFDFKGCYKEYCEREDAAGREPIDALQFLQVAQCVFKCMEFETTIIEEAGSGINLN